MDPADALARTIAYAVDGGHERLWLWQRGVKDALAHMQSLGYTITKHK